MERYKPQDAEERAAMEHAYASNLAIQKRHMRDFQGGVTDARVVELRRANYYVFLSNEADVLGELRAFVAGLH